MIQSSKSRRENGQKLKSVLKLFLSRELKSNSRISVDDIPDSASKLPFVWQRRSLNPGFRNKIFACQWITNNHVVYGTKCNNLVLFDCSLNESFDIPLIKSEPSNSLYLNPCACGIHSIQLNPSRSLLATGGRNVNHIGVYRLAEFVPHCLLRDCHNDWVFDMRWLDDTYLATCSRDSSLALWHISSDDALHEFSPSSTSIHQTINVDTNRPFSTIRRPEAHVISSIPDDRFRALEYLPSLSRLAVVSMSRRLYLYDAIRLGFDKQTRPLFTLVLKDAFQETVALRRWPTEPNCVALATHHCVLLFDIRCSPNKCNAPLRCILPPLAVSGVRSLNFAGSLLSYGTSSGHVHFYDLKADQHLPLQLDVGPGWIKPQTCDDFEVDAAATLAMAARQAFYSHTMGTSLNGYNPTSPPPSPARIAFPSQPSFTTSRLLPLSRAEHFTSQVSNLRIRLGRIQHRLSHLRGRNFSSSNSHVPSIVDAIVSMPINSEPNRPFVSTSSSSSTDFSDRSSASVSPVRSPGSLRERDAEEDSGDSDAPMDVTETRPTLRNIRRVHFRIPLSRPLSLSMNAFANLHSDLNSYPSLSSQRHMLAVYTHEYDPTGTRLFAAGGPIASTFYGNVAVLWE